MSVQQAFNMVNEAVSFENNCFHFQYERAYVKLCMEGNLFETAHRHIVRYFSNTDIPKPFMSQWFKQITMSDELVSCATSHSVSLLNTVCRTHLNGSKCANCKMMRIEVAITFPFIQNE